MKKTYIVTDLGPGDGGKGGVVHKISHMQKAHTIFKVGGAQGSHGVAVSTGEKFAFSQFGCGTFEGVKTYLTPRFIASPEGILNEAEALRYQCGIHNIFDLLSVDERVICATPYHGILSRIKELSLKDNPRGTVGTGVGMAYRFNDQYPDLTIRASDLASNNIKDKLAAIRDQVKTDLELIIENGFLASDQDEAKHNLELLDDSKYLDYIFSRFQKASKLIKVINQEEVVKNIISKDGVIVVESSHGVLTDRFQGFHPHTSAIRTLPSYAKQMLQDWDYDGTIINIGVSRAYQIRHGAGPIPTSDNLMREQLLPGSNKQENRYQGQVRVGPLDLTLLRYAIKVCGGPQFFDGLAITWFDQIQKNGEWLVSTKYEDANLPHPYFSDDGNINIKFGFDQRQLEYQENLGKLLLEVKPKLTRFILGSSGRNELYNLCATFLKSELGVNVRMISFGPTEKDKICK